MNSGCKSKGRSVMCGIAALLVLASTVWPAPGKPPPPGLNYVFMDGVDDPALPHGITDISGNDYHGTVIDADFVEFVAGPSGNSNALHIHGANFRTATQGSGIDTGTTTDNPDLNIFLGPFTSMAWVNLDDFDGDHMVFGTPPPIPGGAGSLNLGFRGTAVYFGFWGAAAMRDSGLEAGFNAGEWHHVAWRFTGAGGAGSQDIFIDGQLVNSFMTANNYGGLLLGDGNVPNVAVNVLIGRTVANNGAFSGALSDVRIYNVALSDDDIATIAAMPP